MIRWNDSIAATTLSWASITPFGRPVVPEVKTSSKTSLGCGAAQPAWRACQSGGKVASGSAAMASTVVVGKRSSRASRGSGASRPVPRMRWRAPDASTTPSIASGDMRRSSGHEDQARPASPRSTWPAAPAWTATRSAGGRPGSDRGRAAARRRSARGDPARDSSRSSSSRHRVGGSGPSGRRSAATASSSRSSRVSRSCSRANATYRRRARRSPVRQSVARSCERRRSRAASVIPRIAMRWSRIAASSAVSNRARSGMPASTSGPYRAHVRA